MVTVDGSSKGVDELNLEVVVRNDLSTNFANVYNLIVEASPFTNPWLSFHWKDVWIVWLSFCVVQLCTSQNWA